MPESILKPVKCGCDLPLNGNSMPWHHASTCKLYQPLPESPGRTPISPRSTQMIRIMLEGGFDKALVAEILEAYNARADHVRYMLGPVIVFQGGWQDQFPDWLERAIYSARFEQIVLEHNGNELGRLATSVEVAAYTHIASLASPLPYRWSNVYLWSIAGALRKYGHLKFPHQAIEETLASLGQGIPENLGIDEQHNFNRLARDIRRDVIKEAAKRKSTNRTRGGKRETKMSFEQLAKELDELCLVDE